mgnify:CR=1 FL=1
MKTLIIYNFSIKSKLLPNYLNLFSFKEKRSAENYHQNYGRIQSSNTILIGDYLCIYTELQNILNDFKKREFNIIINSVYKDKNLIPFSENCLKL